MARRPRRSPEQIRIDRQRAWYTMKNSGECYGGWHVCPICKVRELKYCLGRAYASIRCEDCFLTT